MSAAPGRACCYVGVLIFFCLLSTQLLAHCDSGTKCRCQNCPVQRLAKEGRWYVAETENFYVCSDESASHAESLAKHSEALRAELRFKWLGDDTKSTWHPKCRIVLHQDRRSYVAAVGRGSEKTVGSSLLKVDGKQIVSRRIDLLGGQTDFLAAALPHELTHVVVRDRFVTTAMPRWADEGLAILEDPDSKQGRHEKDLQKAFEEATVFHSAGLLALDDYPTTKQVGTFYGQSASLASFLVKRKSPQEFVNFVAQAEAQGYDSALKSRYGIANVRELDRLWRAYASEARLASAAHER